MMMRQVYTHQILAMVQQMGNVLDLSGIDYEIRNQYAVGGTGEISFLDAWPQLVVNDQDAKRAQKIISDELQRDGEDWRCDACGEINGFAFGACWQCGASNPEDR